MTTSWQPNSQYWIYKRYADQTGLRTSRDRGIAGGRRRLPGCVRDKTKSIVVVGNKGGVTGSVNVVVKNMPAWLQSGGTAKVLLERMPTGTARRPRRRSFRMPR